jgi:hypothetical protein
VTSAAALPAADRSAAGLGAAKADPPPTAAAEIDEPATNRPSVRRRHTPATVPSTRTAATTISPVVSTHPLWHAPRPAAM